MPFRQNCHVLFDERRVILACGHLIMPMEEFSQPRGYFSYAMPAGQPFSLLNKAGVKRKFEINRRSFAVVAICKYCLHPDFK